MLPPIRLPLAFTATLSLARSLARSAAADAATTAAGAAAGSSQLCPIEHNVTGARPCFPHSMLSLAVGQQAAAAALWERYAKALMRPSLLVRQPLLRYSQHRKWRGTQVHPPGCVSTSACLCLPICLAACLCARCQCAGFAPLPQLIWLEPSSAP